MVHLILPSFALLVAAIRHFPNDSSFLYGIDQLSVNTLPSSSYRLVTGNSKGTFGSSWLYSELADCELMYKDIDKFKM